MDVRHLEHVIVNIFAVCDEAYVVENFNIELYVHLVLKRIKTEGVSLIYSC